MSYFNKIGIYGSDSPSVDAFARWRVSSPYTVFDSKTLYDTGSLVWSTQIIGNSTASFNTNAASVDLITSGSNSSIIRQTKRRNIYQPGKSQLILLTGNLQGTASSTIKQIGLFDESNGIYFIASGSFIGVGLRSKSTGTVVDTFISQSSWNIDKMDGTGPSSLTVDFSKSQIFMMDFEWLGVGRVRYGFFENGSLNYVHSINNFNSLDNTYMGSPNLPIRYSIINSGSLPQKITQICSSVVSEGGVQPTGHTKGVANTNNIDATAGNQYGFIALRLKSDQLGSTIVPFNISVGTTATNTVSEVSLLLNPSGSLPWVWNDLKDSVCQYALASANTFLVANEGTKIFSVIIGAGGPIGDLGVEPKLIVGSDVNGTRDILVLAVRDIQAAMGNTNAAITWREVY